MPTASKIHSNIAARKVAALDFTAEDVKDYLDLSNLGIVLDERRINQMAAATGMDAVGQALVTTASITTPVQFLQNWLPGFVQVITAARKIDDLIGIMTAGAWEDEEVVQGVMELTGKAVPYGDYTNIPLSSWNANYERRTNIRFEEGMRVGVLEDARASRANINDSGSKREAAAMSLEITRNTIGFSGYNSGLNRTYGFLNDPNLPAYVANPGPVWASATFLQITADIRTAIIAIRAASKDMIDPSTTPLTLAIASGCVDYLSVTSDFGNSVWDWLDESYPNIRVVSAPELDSANGGSSVFYLYADKVNDKSTDGGATWVQIVPAKFKVVGVQQEAKAYVEDYSNATAGVMLKRPYAVVRYTGLT